MIEHAILSYVNIRYFSRETFGLNYHKAPEGFKNKEMELNIYIYIYIYTHTQHTHTHTHEYLLTQKTMN